MSTTTPKQSASEQSTRQQLLEAAGQVFAEKGFDRATGKEICERAGANTAAVNYYFQGIEGLYSAVLVEAHNRLVSVETLSAAVAGVDDAKAKLQAFIELFVGTLTNPPSSAWVLRVIGREIISPTPFIDELRQKQVLPKMRIIKSVVAELMELPEDHPAVARGAISVMAPCSMLLLADRTNLKVLFPSLSVSPGNAEALVRHLVQFAIAGLNAVAKDELRKKRTS